MEDSSPAVKPSLHRKLSRSKTTPVQRERQDVHQRAHSEDDSGKTLEPQASQSRLSRQERRLYRANQQYRKRMPSTGAESPVAAPVLVRKQTLNARKPSKPDGKTQQQDDPAADDGDGDGNGLEDDDGYLEEEVGVHGQNTPQDAAAAHVTGLTITHTTSPLANQAPNDEKESGKPYELPVSEDERLALMLSILRESLADQLNAQPEPSPDEQVRLIRAFKVEVLRLHLNPDPKDDGGLADLRAQLAKKLDQVSPQPKLPPLQVTEKRNTVSTSPVPAAPRPDPLVAPQGHKARELRHRVQFRSFDAGSDAGDWQEWYQAIQQVTEGTSYHRDADIASLTSNNLRQHVEESRQRQEAIDQGCTHQ